MMSETELHTLFIIMSFTFGLLFGSFSTMASYRIPRKEDLIIKPSHCPKCKHRLGFLDLFPVFSWLFNLGKCRHCKVKVHYRYPAIELVMAILFALAYLKGGVSSLTLALMFMIMWLVIMIVIEFENKQIPNLIIIALMVVGLLYRYAIGSAAYQYFAGAILLLIIVFILYKLAQIFKKDYHVRLDDIRFATAAGIFINPEQMISFLLLSSAVLVTYYIIILKMKKDSKPSLGPALAVSLLIHTIF